MNKLPVHGVILTIALCATSAATPKNLDVSVATCLGGSSSDTAYVVDIGPDGVIVVGGTFAGASFGKTATNLIGTGAGTVVRFASDGRSVLSVSRLGAVVNDLEIGPGGVIAAAGDFGVAVISQDAQSIVWQDASGSARRVAIGSDGTVGALIADSLKTYNSGGARLGALKLTDNNDQDVAISGKDKLVYLSGDNNHSTGRPCGSYGNCPVRVGFVRAFTYTFDIMKWRAWDWPGPWMDGADSVHNQEGNVMGDSPIDRVSVGKDGNLYVTGLPMGGNSMFNYSSIVFGGPGNIVATDKYSNPYNVSSQKFTYIGKLDPSTGEVLKGQMLLTRFTCTAAGKVDKGNSLISNAVSADKDGYVYVCGAAGSSIENRDSLSINGTQVGPYWIDCAAGTKLSGDNFVLVLSPDFSTRLVWTIFSAGLNHRNASFFGIGAGNGYAAAAGFVQGEYMTVNQLQPSYAPSTDSASDGYFVAWNMDAVKTAASTIISHDVNHWAMRGFTVAAKRGVIVVDLPSSAGHGARVRLLKIDGSCAAEATAGPSSTALLDVKKLTPGAYLVVVTSVNGPALAEPVVWSSGR